MEIKYETKLDTKKKHTMEKQKFFVSMDCIRNWHNRAANVHSCNSIAYL